MRFIWFTLFSVFLAFSPCVEAAEKFSSALPFHLMFPTPSGILFPSLLSAAGVNPAALPQKGSAATAFGLSYSPAPGGVGNHDYSVALARGDKRMGVGGGYLGSIGATTPVHSVYFGGGFRSESTSIGFGLRDSDLSDGFAPATDLGIIASGSSELSFGFVLHNLQEEPQLDFAIGFGRDKNYNFEVSVLMPQMADAFRSDSAYTITASTNVYASVFGVSFSSSYTTFPASVNQSVSLLVWMSKHFGLTIQYRSPNRSYYGIIATF